jgi:hypothetical protein
MAGLDRNEINRIHVNFRRGRGLIRLVHIPTGISVEAYSERETIKWSLQTNDRLMKELEEKVAQARDAGKP